MTIPLLPRLAIPTSLRGLRGETGPFPFALPLGTPEPAETTPISGVQGLVDDGSPDECLDLRGSCY